VIAQVTEVVLAFGSNQGDRAQTIHDAQMLLAETPGIEAVQPSPLRETVALTPTGLDPDAPRYLNSVAKVTTTLDPHQLLTRTREIETALGRVRHEQWGDRTLDIDIIVFGGKVIADPDLIVPHPRAHERDFVLAPWHALDPDAVLIGHGRIAALLEQLGDSTTSFTQEVPR
jgi:2-amino-4-hydroxy-6-hydroxymethyldihydropteridine diphosphokinase